MKLRTFIICDDIRSEVNGKNSLIGTYRDKIIFNIQKGQKNTWPKVIKLAFYVEILVEGSLPKTFNFKRIDEEGAESVVLQGDLPFKKDSTLLRMNLIHPAFMFNKVGTIIFKLEFFDKTGKLTNTIEPPMSFKVEEQFVGS